ncbi:hypothetical protein SHIRM173S_02207 [Streptomyces hirsutus]
MGLAGSGTVDGGVAIDGLGVAGGLVLCLGVAQAAGLVGPAGPVRGRATESAGRAGSGAVVGGRGPGFGQAAITVVAEALSVPAPRLVDDRLDVAGGVVRVVDVAGVAGVGLVDGVGVDQSAGAVLVAVEDLELLGTCGGAQAGLLDLAVRGVADVLDVVGHAVGTGEHAEAVVAVSDALGGQAGYRGHRGGLDRAVDVVRGGGGERLRRAGGDQGVGGGDDGLGALGTAKCVVAGDDLGVDLACGAADVADRGGRLSLGQGVVGELGQLVGVVLHPVPGAGLAAEHVVVGD